MAERIEVNINKKRKFSKTYTDPTVKLNSHIYFEEDETKTDSVEDEKSKQIELLSAELEIYKRENQRKDSVIKIKDRENQRKDLVIKIKDRENQRKDLVIKRLDFFNNVKNKDFNTIQALVAAIDDLQLDIVINPGIHYPPSTEEIIKNDKMSKSSFPDVIEISRFKIIQLAERPSLKKMKIYESKMRKKVIDAGGISEESFDQIILEETIIYNKIMKVLKFFKSSNYKLQELEFQMIVVLFIDGIIVKYNSLLAGSPITNHYRAHDINGVKISTEIEALRNNEVVNVSLSGKSDIGLLYSSSHSPKVNLSSVTSRKTIIGEVKVFGRMLSGTSAEIIKCSNQLFGQLLTLSQMRESIQSLESQKYSVTKTFLTDLEGIRLAFCIQNNYASTPPVYLISSLFKGANAFISGIMFLISLLSDKSVEKLISNKNFKQMVEIDSDKQNVVLAIGPDNNNNKMTGSRSLHGDFENSNDNNNNHRSNSNYNTNNKKSNNNKSNNNNKSHDKVIDSVQKSVDSEETVVINFGSMETERMERESKLRLEFQYLRFGEILMNKESLDQRGYRSTIDRFRDVMID